MKLHYGWIILLTTFLALFAVQGVRLAFGAFIIPWEDDFSLDRGMISLISTLSFIVYGLSQPVIGQLIDRYGARIIIIVSTALVGVSIIITAMVQHSWQLFLLYGCFVLLGVGGTSNVAAASIVTKWFTAKRGFALGIVEAGFGAGQMLMVPGSLILIQLMGWRGTVVVLGLCLLLVVVPIITILIRNKPSDKGIMPYGGEEERGNALHEESRISTWDVLRDCKFWFIIVPFVFCGFTTTGLMDTHLIPFAHDHGFSTHTTGSAVSVLAAFNIIGILLSGYLADRWSSRKILIYLYIARGLSLILLIVSNQSVLLLIFSAIFGLVDFATVAPTQLLATKYFDKNIVGFIIGWLFLGHQVGSALGSYIPGLLYSHNGHYTNAFYISILILLLATFMVYLLPKNEAEN